MPKLSDHSTTVLAATKGRRKKDQGLGLSGETAKKTKKLRSLVQILSLNQAAVSMVDRDLVESRLAISAINNSVDLSLEEIRNKQQEPNVKKTKKRLSLVKSRH